MKPFHNQIVDQWPKREKKKVTTWPLWLAFGLLFALLFNGCVQNVQYQDNYRGVEQAE